MLLRIERTGAFLRIFRTITRKYCSVRRSLTDPPARSEAVEPGPLGERRECRPARRGALHSQGALRLALGRASAAGAGAARGTRRAAPLPEVGAWWRRQALGYAAGSTWPPAPRRGPAHWPAATCAASGSRS